MTTQKSWFKRNASTLFIVGLLFVGAGMVVHGGYLKMRKPPEPPVGAKVAPSLEKGDTVMSLIGEIEFQIGAALVLLALTTVVFSFSDMKEFLSSGIASLFTSADIVPILSKKTKSHLHRRLAEDRVEADAERIPDDLFNFLSELGDEQAKTVHAYNLTISKSVEPVAGTAPVLFRYTVLMSFDLNAAHLRNQNSVAPVRFSEVTTFSDPAPIDKFKWLEKISIHIDDQEYSRRSPEISVSEKTEHGHVVYSMGFEKRLEIVGRVAVRAEYTFLSPKSDSTEFFVCARPTKGFSGTLKTLSDQVCYGKWLSPAANNSKSKQNVQCSGSSCSMTSSDWILPKGGAVILVDKK